MSLPVSIDGVSILPSRARVPVHCAHIVELHVGAVSTASLKRARDGPRHYSSREDVRARQTKPADLGGRLRRPRPRPRRSKPASGRRRDGTKPARLDDRGAATTTATATAVDETTELGPAGQCQVDLSPNASVRKRNRSVVSLLQAIAMGFVTSLRFVRYPRLHRPRTNRTKTYCIPTEFCRHAARGCAPLRLALPRLLRPPVDAFTLSSPLTHRNPCPLLVCISDLSTRFTVTAAEPATPTSSE
jgi:hypothetical protein